MDVRSPEDIYPLVEDLIIRLGRDREKRLSAILDHRLHKVAWTSASELLEELKRVLGSEAVQPEALSPQTDAAMKQVVAGINELLKDA